MMIDPPIDKLVELVDCKYALACLVARRTKFVLEKKEEQMHEAGLRPVSYAAKEIYDKKVEFFYDE